MTYDTAESAVPLRQWSALFAAPYQEHRAMRATPRDATDVRVLLHILRAALWRISDADLRLISAPATVADLHARMAAIDQLLGEDLTQ